MLEQHGAYGADKTLGEAAVFFGAHSCHDAHPAVLFLLTHGILYLKGACAWTFGVGKDVQMRYVETIHEGARRFEAPGSLRAHQQ